MMLKMKSAGFPLTDCVLWLKELNASDIRDIFAEAKSAGFDVKAMRTVLKLRKMNAADRDEQELVVETYRKALDI